MIEWYNKWINMEPDKYFAYIYVDGTEEPVGEIYYYPDGDYDHFETEEIIKFILEGKKSMLSF